MKRKRGYKNKVVLVAPSGRPNTFDLLKVHGAYEDDNGRLLIELSNGDDIYSEFVKIFESAQDAENYYKEAMGIKNDEHSKFVFCNKRSERSEES